jgi:hypothetical protein
MIEVMVGTLVLRGERNMAKTEELKEQRKHKRFSPKNSAFAVSERFELLGMCRASFNALAWEPGFPNKDTHFQDLGRNFVHVPFGSQTHSMQFFRRCLNLSQFAFCLPSSGFLSSLNKFRE